jgi:hypothetical protein
MTEQHLRIALEAAAVGSLVSILMALIYACDRLAKIYNILDSETRDIRLMQIIRR